MNAFDLQDEFDRYRAEGGRCSFTEWCARYGDNYDCDAEWLAEDYARAWWRCEDDGRPHPSFRVWLEGETAEYRETHMGNAGVS